MARKATNGYPEKSYYDNTVFSGVVATNDPLNEGSFALLSNLDIADTGRSLTPRKGFLTTTIKTSTGSIVLSNKILHYRDPKIKKHIILDLNKFNRGPWAFSVDITPYNIKEDSKLQSDVISQLSIDISDLVHLADKHITFNQETDVEKVMYLLDNSEIINSSELKSITDKDGVRFYITKLRFDDASVNFNYVIKILYREKGYMGLSDDTLVLSYVDTDIQTTNLLKMNIASTLSIIPDPLRVISNEDLAVAPVLLPTLLLKDVSITPNKYFNQTLPRDYRQSLSKIKLETAFNLPKATTLFPNVSVADWAYRLDIINTNEAGVAKKYTTPWRKIENLYGVNQNPTLSEQLLSAKPVKTYYVHATITDADEQLSRPQTGNGFDYTETEMFEALRGTYSFNYSLRGAQTETQKIRTILSRLSEGETLNTEDIAQLKRRLYTFMPEESVQEHIGQTYGTLQSNRDRALALDSNEISTLSDSPHLYDSNAVSTNAPRLYFSRSGYESVTKYGVDDFLSLMLDELEEYNINFVLLPYTLHMYNPINHQPEDYFLMSLQGIYITGLKNFVVDFGSNPSLSLGAIAPYDLMQETTAQLLVHRVDMWDNQIMGYSDFTNTTLQDFVDDGVPAEVFNVGVYMVLYLKAYTPDMLSNLDTSTRIKRIINNQAWDASAYMLTSAYTWHDDYLYINEKDEENADLIMSAERLIVFEDRVVTWQDNKVFISEEGDYGYFLGSMLREFPEEVLKVIAFKTILLVFTTQHLYAIYRAEVDTATGTFNEEGTPEYAKTIEWFQQPVLYNLNPSKEYLEVIQVYNQMILFYSDEGQLYMIRPSTTIDSETQFSIQYFNKSANDILMNYTHYINERLIHYGKITSEDYENFITKDKVKINCLVDIDFIKIFYTVPDQITFILIYDVINNRYTTYDTLSFTSVKSLQHVEGGEMYLTTEGSSTFITLPMLPKNDVDQNADTHYKRQYRKEPIFALVDSGNLNLNNHLKKRLRDLRVVLKNIDSTRILYNAEIFADDSRVHPFYAPDFKVRMINGPDYKMTIDEMSVEDVNELFGMNQTIGVEGSRTDMKLFYLHDDNQFYERNRLLKTETINSNKLIEYNSSVLASGKVFRLKLQFISKGKYKLQSYSIVYKERKI